MLLPLARRVQDWLDAVLPHFDDADARWRARTLVSACSLVYLSGPVFAVYTALSGDWAMTAVNLSTLSFPPLLVVMLRWTRSPVAVSIFMGLLGTVAIGLTTWDWERTGGAMLPWLAFLVLLVVFAGGRWVGALFASLSLCIIGWFYVSAGGSTPGEHGDYITVAALNGSMFMLFALVTASIWDGARQSALNDSLAAAERLVDAQRKALVAERLASVGTLATGVAHEINTPLTYLTLTLEQLASRPLERAEVQRLAGEALEGGRHVQTIVAQLQSFARGDVAVARPVPVQRPVDAALRMLRNQIRQHGGIEVDVDPRACVRINEGQLAQVLVNLLQNALHAMEGRPAGRLGIHVAVREDHVDIVVSDTGTGIEPALLDHLFEPFFTTKPVGRGTGLGLSISKGIIDAAGGQILVDSEVDVGTTVTLVLPQQTAQPESAPAAPSADTDQALAPRRLRVLVIDDEPQLGRVVRRALQGLHDVDVHSSAAEALTRVPEGYDVVLCDVMMPEMAGWDFYAALQDLDPELAGRTVFMTGGVFTQQARLFLEQHREHMLSKPFTTEELADTVARAAERSPTRAG